MLALPVVWAGRDRPAVTPPASQMAFLGRWQPARRPLGMALTPTRPLTLADVMRRLALSTSLRGHRTPGVGRCSAFQRLPAGEFDLVVDGRSRLAGTAHGAARPGRPADGGVAARRAPGRHHRPGAAACRPSRTRSPSPATTRRGSRSAGWSCGRGRCPPSGTAGRGPARVPPRRPGRSSRSTTTPSSSPGAAWVRGERRARFIVQPDAGAAPVRRGSRAGRSPTPCRSNRGDWHTEVLPLAPEEIAGRDAAGRAALAPAMLSVTSATGFRPSEHDAGVDDVRRLGVYCTLAVIRAGGAPPVRSGSVHAEVPAGELQRAGVVAHLVEDVDRAVAELDAEVLAGS